MVAYLQVKVRQFMVPLAERKIHLFFLLLTSYKFVSFSYSFFTSDNLIAEQELAFTRL